jgi:hypothetical protein
MIKGKDRGRAVALGQSILSSFPKASGLQSLLNRLLLGAEQTVQQLGVDFEFWVLIYMECIDRQLVRHRRIPKAVLGSDH